MDTRTADIIANEWPTANVGGPHWRGYGNLNLVRTLTMRIMERECKSPQYKSCFIYIYHGAVDIRLALSVRQLCCVSDGLCLYAPLAVKIMA